MPGFDLDQSQKQAPTREGIGAESLAEVPIIGVKMPNLREKHATTFGRFSSHFGGLSRIAHPL